MPSDPWQPKIDAYVDGELEPGEARQMAAHLRECAVCAAEVAQHGELKRKVRIAAFEHRPSAEFRRRIEAQVTSRTRRSRRWLWVPALAAAAVLVAVGIIGFTVRQWEGNRQQLMAQLTDMHVATLASANPVDVVSTDRHTVKPWFEGKLPFAVNLPEFQGTPFTLVGGRIAYLRHQPGAQLIVGKEKHRLSVFIFQDRGGLAGTFSAKEKSASAASFNVESWTKDGLRFFAVGDVPRDDLRQLATLLRGAGS